MAFIGGSITQMNGYRPMVSEWLQQRFPDTKFEFINAGIGTCSHTGRSGWTTTFCPGPDRPAVRGVRGNDNQDARHTMALHHRHGRHR